MTASADVSIASISHSKRLQTVQAPLLSQGISVEFSRGKTRTITIKNMSKKS